MGPQIIDFDKELADAQKETAATLKILIENGYVPDTTEWLTIRDYAYKYNLSTPVVTDWIIGGIIPRDSIMVVPELNDIQLVKDQSYRYVVHSSKHEV